MDSVGTFMAFCITIITAGVFVKIYLFHLSFLVLA